jgi:hypothetical protein
MDPAIGVFGDQDATVRSIAVDEEIAQLRRGGRVDDASIHELLGFDLPTQHGRSLAGALSCAKRREERNAC